ncbi:MAG: histidine ammonia-lyase, partial [Phycisphaerales bacterium]|nr:histidine ammonia-lyase [Phycisphaerales bacterium]
MAKRASRSGDSQNVVTLTPGPLSIDAVVGVAREGAGVALSPKSIAAMKRSRRVVESCLTDGEAHYGINTGFGSLAKQRIGAADLATLQRNLIRSHSAGVGEALREELVRAMMVTLAGSLARGYSGVRPLVVETLIAMLNAGVTPEVPSIGSVGASGDLAPLAHIALCMIGEGTATVRGAATKAMPAAKALAKAGIKPLTLEAKEGLALINGTHLMCAEGALLAHDAMRLFDAACVATAMSIDGCRASHSFLDDRLYVARNNWGGRAVAERIRELLRGGKIAASHVENDPRVQDPYSLRAAPTVLGAALQTITHVSSVVDAELGGVTDNPLVFAGEARGANTDAGAATDEIVSGANFHGMPLAIPLDCLSIALCHIAGISERRSYLMTGAFEPESRLKPFLTEQPGLSSGLMIAQYTAAACVNEMIGLCTPASVSNISTCAGMEDYNSFGPRGAAKARRALELATNVVAIELLCAAQAIDTHRPLRSGRGVEAAHAKIRSKVKTLREDRVLTGDVGAIAG